MLKIGRIRLHSFYLTKKIEASAFKTVLASTFKTAYRLLMITNGVKELQEFATIEHPDYFLTALIKTDYVLAGDAKRQAWNVTHLHPLLSQKPKYTLRCSLTHKNSNKVVYRSIIESIKPELIYSQIQECIQDLNVILDK